MEFRHSQQRTGISELRLGARGVLWDAAIIVRPLCKLYLLLADPLDQAVKLKFALWVFLCIETTGFIFSDDPRILLIILS